MQIINKKGFSILEIVVSVSLFVFLILLVNSMFVMSQKSYNTGSDQGELAQNARVSVDRLSREIRQSEEIVTLMPATDAEMGFPPVHEIFFQDGHDISQTTYIRYYLSGTDLMRANIAYYFAGDPSTYVRWDSLDASAQPATALVLEDRVIGEFFSRLEFWGDNNLINISCGLAKDASVLDVDTRVFSRN